MASIYGQKISDVLIAFHEDSFIPERTKGGQVTCTSVIHAMFVHWFGYK